MAKQTELSPSDYQKIGRDLEGLLVKNYIDALHSTPRQIWHSFMRGFFAGLGGVIGATVGVAVLLGILSFLATHLHIFGPFFKSLSDTINSTNGSQ